MSYINVFQTNPGSRGSVEDFINAESDELASDDGEYNYFNMSDEELVACVFILKKLDELSSGSALVVWKDLY